MNRKFLQFPQMQCTSVMNILHWVTIEKKMHQQLEERLYLSTSASQETLNDTDVIYIYKKYLAFLLHIIDH